MMNLREEAARCYLCRNPRCSAACQKGCDPARMVRSVRFGNEVGGAACMDAASCLDCGGDCELACIQNDRPVRIRKMEGLLPPKIDCPEVSLKTGFMGLQCENPFFLSSSVVASSYAMVARAFEAGWGGVVYKTAGFIRPEEVSPRFDALRKEGTPFVGFKNLEQISDVELAENLKILSRLKKNYPTKIVAASIMGRNTQEWGLLAKLVTNAGADMIECNFSCPHMKGSGLGSDVGQNPELVAEYTAAVRQNTRLPVLAKMTPNIGNMEIPAEAAVKAGADGLAAINTVKSFFGIDPETLTPEMDVSGKNSVSGYSGKAVKPIALRFIHDLAECPALAGVSLSGMGGIETWEDALDFIALGCGNVQVTTAVMEYGYRIIEDLTDGLKRFLFRKGISCVNDLVGAALPSVVPPDNLDRGSIVYPRFDREKCVGCGRCEISCADAGHSAVALCDGRPVLQPVKCVGCLLCSLVCPMQAISVSPRTAKRQSSESR